MDLSEFKCCTEKCREMSDVECTCKKINKFCFVHYKLHKGLMHCKFIDIEEKIWLKKILLVNNAINSLYIRLITLSLAEVEKINTSLREDHNFIGLKEFQLKNSGDNDESLDYIIAFARKFSIKNRDKSYFISNSQRFLGISDESEKYRNKYKDESIKFDDELDEKSYNIESLKRKLKKRRTEFSKIKTKEKLLNNKKKLEKKLPYAKMLCNLDSANFNEMSVEQAVESLIQEKYNDINIFVGRSEIKIWKISITNCLKFIFVCKF